MKLVIEGREYDVASIGKASLADLVALKTQTGMGISAIREGLANAQALKDGALDDEQALLALGALVFLTRRRAGERVTFEEACAFPLTELDVILEPGDELVESDNDESTADPQSPGSAQAGSGGGARGRKGSTTSKRRS